MEGLRASGRGSYFTDHPWPAGYVYSHYKSCYSRVADEEAEAQEHPVLRPRLRTEAGEGTEEQEEGEELSSDSRDAHHCTNEEEELRSKLGSAQLEARLLSFPPIPLALRDATKFILEILDQSLLAPRRPSWPGAQRQYTGASGTVLTHPDLLVRQLTLSSGKKADSKSEGLRRWVGRSSREKGTEGM